MERGLPNAGDVVVNRKAGAVYDLEHHQPVPFICSKGKTRIHTSFTTNDGKLLLLTSKPLGKLAVDTPSTTRRNSSFTLTVNSLDTDVIIPIAVDITVATGLRLDNSGSGIVKDGKFSRTISLPANLPKGNVTINITNLADGSVISKTIRVE